METKSILYQLACTLILNLQTATVAFSIVWPSYALKVLEGESSPLGFPLSKNESNLVGSIPMLGSVLMMLLAGFVCESIGRKKSQIIGSLLFVVAWSLILTARSIVQILIGRFLTGLSSGLALVVIVVYVSEITHVSIRGSATAMLSFFYNIGILISYLEGWFLSYNVICYISVTVCVISTIILCCLKETPAYLLMIGREKEALSSLKFYRCESNTTKEILDELADIKRQVFKTKEITELTSNEAEKEKFQEEENEFSKDEKKENPLKLLFTVDYNRRALIILVAFMMLNVSLGMVAVQTYAGTFFTMAAPTLSPDLCSVLLALVFVVSSVVAIVVTKMVPRRVMMISSCATVTICLAVLGSLLRWSYGPAWLAPLVVAVYCCVFHLGCINIVVVQIAEVFGPQISSTATAIILSSMNVMNFIVLTLFVPSINYLGIDGTFFVFAAIGAITTVLSVILIRESRNVPLEKVQKMYAQGFVNRKCN